MKRNLLLLVGFLELVYVPHLWAEANPVIGEAFVPQSANFVVIDRIPRPRMVGATGNAQTCGIIFDEYVRAASSVLRLQLLECAERLKSNLHSRALGLFFQSYIEQHEHNFPVAVNLINEALELDPSFSEASILGSSIMQVTGDYNASKKFLSKLNSQHYLKYKIIATLWLDSLSGQLDLAYNQLVAYKSKASDSDTDDFLFYRALADVCARRGDLDCTKSSLKSLLLVRPSNIPAVCELADIYFNEKDLESARVALAGKGTHEAILVRLVRLDKDMSEREKRSTSHRASLELALLSVFETLNLRGATSHYRELSYYYLYVQKDFSKAQDFALKNWEAQRETQDVKLLADATRGVGEPNIPVSVELWRKASRYEAIFLRSL